MAPYDIDVLTPDEFLVHQYHLNRELLLEKLGEQAAQAQMSLADLLARLSRWAPGVCGLLSELH